MAISNGLHCAANMAAVTKSDTTVVNCRAVYVGTAGDLAVMPLNGSTAVTFKNVASGSILPVQAAKIMSANTTAADIVALF